MRNCLLAFFIFSCACFSVGPPAHAQRGAIHVVPDHGACAQQGGSEYMFKNSDTRNVIAVITERTSKAGSRPTDLTINSAAGQDVDLGCSVVVDGYGGHFTQTFALKSVRY